MTLFVTDGAAVVVVGIGDSGSWILLAAVVLTHNTAEDFCGVACIDKKHCNYSLTSTVYTVTLPIGCLDLMNP